jgi:hypothetical protein
VSLRDEILAGQSERRRAVPYDVEAWGVRVWIRPLSVADQRELANGHEAGDVPVLTLIHALVDENSNPIFTQDDLEALSSEPFRAVLEVFAEVARHNGLSTAELDEAMATFQGGPPAGPDISDGPGPGADG